MLFSVPAYEGSNTGVEHLTAYIYNIFKVPMSIEKSKDFSERKRHLEYNKSLGLWKLHASRSWKSGFQLGFSYVQVFLDWKMHVYSMHHM